MQNLERIHQTIYNDPEWRACNAIIDAYTIDDDLEFGYHHGMTHAFNVSNIATDFVKDAGGHWRDIILADIAGMLCDCGLICGAYNYAYNGSKIAETILRARWGNGHPLKDEDIAVICHAIANHRTGDDIRTIVDAALCIADKVDIGKNRVKNACCPTQVAQTHIQKVNYSFSDDGTLILNYAADEDFDVYKFIENWPDAYRIPAKVATFLGKKFSLFLDNVYRVNLPD